MRTNRSGGRRLLHLLLVVALLIGLAFLGLAGFRSGSPAQVTVSSQLPAIGRRTPIQIAAREPRRGLARLRVELQQGERREVLAERDFRPRPAWVFWGPTSADERLTVEVGRETITGLTAQPLTVRAIAESAPAWFHRPPPAVQELTLPVRLVPPSLEVLSTQTYAAQGGCETVVYRVGETAVRDGVRAGEAWFPGHALPGGGARDRFALFAVPYDLSDPGAVRLQVADDVGNEASRPFLDRFFPRPPKSDLIELTPAFLEKVVPEILSRTPTLADRGGLLENYLAINGELRRQNAEELLAIGRQSAESFLWSEAFLPIPNAQVMAAFADRRTYHFQNQAVDQQVHLGFDLASVRQSPVPATNRGVVRLARYLGIYGNTVILDHGFGLMSLYAHLSSIEVSEGQEVARGAALGRTGETGLAGGDHLHFTFLLAGVPVTPIEWWDAHWIQDRIDRKLGAALPFAG